MPPPTTATTLSIVAGVAVTAVGAAVLVAQQVASKEGQRQPRPTPPATRLVKDTSISYSLKVSPEHCDESGRMYGGELLKLIDVAAGVVAAKHAGGPCLTVSVDRVIFLQEIRVQDVVHIQSAVNRAWGSSMEIGVRVTRETPLGQKTYCCHSYLTFVMKTILPTSSASSAPSSSWALSKWLLGLRSVDVPKPPKRAQVPGLETRTSLEQKRYLLAGRRRAHRISSSEANDRMLGAFRRQILEIEREALAEKEAAEEDQNREDLLETLQREMMVEAWLRQDEDLKIEGEWVVASIEGFMEPVKMRLKDMERASRQRGHGGYRTLAIPRNSTMDGSPSAALGGTKRKSVEDRSPIPMSDTMVTSLWIVRPQHCNSKQVLFGGTLMRWVEETCSIAARRVWNGPWSSAAIDSLTFKSAVLPGEVVYVRACIIKVWESSVECWALALAEDRNSPIPTTRLVSESFFSMVAIDSDSGRPLKGGLKPVYPPGGAAKEIADGADKRREDRLLDKRILQQIYA